LRSGERMAASGVLQYLHQQKWNQMKERERSLILCILVTTARAATAIIAPATNINSSRITIFLEFFGHLSGIMVVLLVQTVGHQHLADVIITPLAGLCQRMISRHDKRNSSWAPSYPNRGQISGTRLGFGDLPIAEQDGEHHVSRCLRDRFWLSRFSSDDGELLMELRSAHAYTSLASAPQGRGDPTQAHAASQSGT